MGRHALAVSLGLVVLTQFHIAAADQGYFSDGKKQLTFKEAGSRSKTERITLYSIFGSAALMGVVGTYYTFDSKSLSDEVSASGYHTGLVWNDELEATRKDALRSRTIAQVTGGIAGGLLLAGIAAYIITEPDEEVGYQDWQTRSFAAPTADGFVVGQGWTF